MSEGKIISSQTTLTVVSGAIACSTFFFDTLIVKAIEGFISEEIAGELIDGVDFIPGEGGIKIGRGFNPKELNFIKNSEGELIVTAPDASNFSIDSSTGGLIYTY